MKLSLPKPSLKNASITLVTLIVVAVYAGGIWYVGRLEGAVRQQASDLAFEVKREASLRDLGGFLEDVREDAATLASFFVAPEDAVTVIERVEGLGTVAGAPVEISGVRILDEDERTGEGTMVMDVNAVGSWNSVMRLAQLLDTFPFASRIDDMSFRRGAAAEGGSTMWMFRATMQLTLRN
jgi:hypothetical protein